jgi:small-conductance mechanosensitive channel
VLNTLMELAVTVSAAAAASALLVWLLPVALRPLARRSRAMHWLVGRCARPAALLLPLAGLHVVLAAAGTEGATALGGAVLVLGIGALSWLVVRAISALELALLERHPMDGPDNFEARSLQTQVRVLARSAMALVVLVGAALALMTLPAARQIGATLLASAGVAGLVAGFAARPVLGNLIAGLQIGLAQPIRLDDVVIVLGQWGRIEEITLTYVVVRLWDRRCLVVPLQWFIENPFENWTRRTAELTGSVLLWVDYAMPLEPLRGELERLCRDAPEWDGRACTLQVVEASERAMQLRALVSAADAPACWTLRCKVREGLIAWLAREHPDRLPRVRAEIEAGEALVPG